MKWFIRVCLGLSVAFFFYDLWCELDRYELWPYDALG